MIMSEIEQQAFDDDLRIRAIWQHQENIEASTRLLNLLRRHHTKHESDDLSNKEHRNNIEASDKLLVLLQRHHGKG